jgi:hypothetical protein
MKTMIATGYAVSVGAAAALLAGCGASQLPSATSPRGTAPFAITHHMTFRYTGQKQTFEVPRGVTRIHVIALGGNGGGSVIARGARVSAVIPVTPSETLSIYVGGAGTSPGGGFNGGGAGGTILTTYSSSSGYGGGGASDIREGGNALKDRVVVAGGGGGQGNALSYGKRYSEAGKGGKLTGGSGKAGCCKRYRNGGGGGTGGTQSQGGTGGEGPQNAGESGQLGIGGSGGSGCGGSTCGYNGGNGGGGGGGYYAGGGGGGGDFFGCCGNGGGGGGGGGSSYAEPNALNVQMVPGAKDADGDGLVIFNWKVQ